VRRDAREAHEIPPAMSSDTASASELPPDRDGIPPNGSVARRFSSEVELRGVLTRLADAVESLERDPILGRDWVGIEELAAHPAIGETTFDSGDGRLHPLAEALRRSGRWESERLRRGQGWIRMWRRIEAPESAAEG